MQFYPKDEGFLYNFIFLTPCAYFTTTLLKLQIHHSTAFRPSGRLHCLLRQVFSIDAVRYATHKKESLENSRLSSCTLQDSNLRPFGPEPNALSPELRVRRQRFPRCPKTATSILHGNSANVKHFRSYFFNFQKKHEQPVVRRHQEWQKAALKMAKKRRQE